MRANTCISYCISWTEIHPLAHIARYPHGGTDVVRLRYRRICADVPPARVWPCMSVTASRVQMDLLGILAMNRARPLRAACHITGR